MVYPIKKGMKSVMSEETKCSLKRRYIIENLFSWMNHYKRIRMRYEVKVGHYESMVQMCMVCIIINKVDM